MISQRYIYSNFYGVSFNPFFNMGIDENLNKEFKDCFFNSFEDTIATKGTEEIIIDSVYLTK